ncbi:MAG: ABC transporter substrate-binding protein [Vicinamibacterales bacterium]
MSRSFLMLLLRIMVAIVVIGAVGYALVVRNMYYTPASMLRAGRPWPPDSVKIAVPWPQDGRVSLIQGVTLALEELNASDSPLANRVNVEFINEPIGDPDTGAIARNIARDDEVMAVIGHESSEYAIQSAVTYEDKGILYLSPKATLSRLTEHAFQYTFRLVPDDEAFAQALAKFAASQKWKRIGVLYGRFEQGEALARWFPNYAATNGLEAAYFRSYLPAPDFRRQDFRPLLATMRTEKVDAILLSDQLPWAAKVLLDMQAMGFTQPILAGDKLDSSDVWRIADKAADNLYVASAVDPESASPPYISFRQRFAGRFRDAEGRPQSPGYGSAQGYEAFRLWVDAAEQSQSVDPVVLATTIKTNRWVGLFGPFGFTTDGAITGRSVIIKRVQDRAFKTVAAHEVTP